MNPEDKYWMPDTTPKDKSSKKKHRPTHRFEAVESVEDDLHRGALPQGGKEDTEDVLRFVEGDEATNAFVAQQKRDKKKKKRGKSKDALPLAEIGDLVALVVTVHKDGQIKYSGVKMESKAATDGPKVTELPTEEEEATHPGRQEEATRDEEILNSLHDLAQNTDKEMLEKIMINKIEMAALEAHEQRKRDQDVRIRAERKRRNEEREKKQAEERAEERAKEAEERAREAEERAKKEAEERARKEAEERVKKEADERAKKEAASVNGVSKTKTSKKKRSGQSGGAATQNKSTPDKPLEPVVKDGLPDGGGLLNGDVKHKVKLRQCANCKQTEASLKLFKKCQK